MTSHPNSQNTKKEKEKKKTTMHWKYRTLGQAQKCAFICSTKLNKIIYVSSDLENIFTFLMKF